MTGTPGNNKAAKYIVKRFTQIGLKPGGSDGGWFQGFPTRNCRVAAAGTSLHFTHTLRAVRARLHEDFAPMAAGATGFAAIDAVVDAIGEIDSADPGDDESENPYRLNTKDDFTKSELIQLLEENDVEHDPKSNKDILFGQLSESFE